MFCLSKPDRPSVDAFLAAAASDKLSYSDVGATLSSPPDGYNLDHNRTMIGHGNEDWERAKDSIRSWKMFDLGWVELRWPDTPIETGRDVAILVSHLGFYSLNAARIVHTIDEPERFGFAYGTLTNHAESGEERFSVELNQDTGEVWYDLYAFSRPNGLITKLGYQVTRHLQKQFARDSLAAMARATVEWS